MMAKCCIKMVPLWNCHTNNFILTTYCELWHNKLWIRGYHHKCYNAKVWYQNVEHFIMSSLVFCGVFQEERTWFSMFPRGFLLFCKQIKRPTELLLPLEPFVCFLQVALQPRRTLLIWEIDALFCSAWFASKSNIFGSRRTQNLVEWHLFDKLYFLHKIHTGLKELNHFPFLAEIFLFSFKCALKHDAILATQTHFSGFFCPLCTLSSTSTTGNASRSKIKFANFKIQFADPLCCAL